MKTKLGALVLCLVSIVMISCQKDPVREATEQYIKANSQQVAMLSAVSAYLDMNGGSKIDASVEISEWNSTPIDTLTKDDFYLFELKRRIKEANDYKRHTLYNDSMTIVRYQQRLRGAYVSEYTKRSLEDAKERQRLHLAQYKNMVDNVNLIKEKQYGSDGKEPIYLVYQFTESLIFTHPTSKEKVSREFNCFSYVSLIKQAVTYVEEGVDDYSPKFENLVSPFKEKEFEVEDELELI